MQVQKQIDELLALRASEWFELLPTASADQLRALEAWLSESRLHVQEFLEIAEVEFCLQRLDPQRCHDLDSLLKRVAPNVAPLPKRAVARLFPARRFRWKVAGLAAGLLAAAITLYGLVSPLYSKHHATEIGEQRIVELGDTS